MLLGKEEIGNTQEGETDFTGMYYPVIDFRLTRSQNGLSYM